MIPVLLGLCLSAEVLDRVAVSVGNSVITESEIRHQLKVRALLEGTPLDLNGEAKRNAADRLIEQTLIRREMQSARYSLPEPTIAETLMASFKQTRYGGDEARYRQDLERHRLKDDDLKAAFLWQLSVLRFVEFRFRPGIQIPPEELREYYDKTFTADWKKRTPTEPVPPFEEAERTCEEALIQERIDNALDRWISQSRTQFSIRYREEVFR